jgi:hypothetical protein
VELRVADKVVPEEVVKEVERFDKVGGPRVVKVAVGLYPIPFGLLARMRK